MNEIAYESVFALYIEKLIAQKRSIGYKYKCQAEIFKRFDSFCLQKYPGETSITKEMAEEWSAKSPVEKEGTTRVRATIVSHLAIYMNRLGIKAYVFPTNSLPKEKKYISYIYSDDELTRLFKQIDNCKYSSIVPFRHLIMPVLFRILYCCGIRLGEALRLKFGDIDLNNGTLTVLDSKYGNDRIVPMTSALTEICVDYSEKVHKLSNFNAYFFSAPSGDRITDINIYTNFRRFMRRSAISHGGRGKGPRIYDFRHTFAVNCLRKMVVEGKDMNAYYPVLKTYMGHSLFKYTAYYLKLTKNMYPNISAKLEAAFGDLILSPNDGGELDG